MMSGPVRLSTQSGTAGISVTAQGLEVSEVGNARVRLQRPLTVQNGEFFDEDSAKYVSLATILQNFLPSVRTLVSGFKALVA
jgi:hypothetical protein